MIFNDLRRRAARRVPTRKLFTIVLSGVDKGAFRCYIYTMITKKSFTATFAAPLGKVSRVTGKPIVTKAIVADDRAHAVRIACRMSLGVPVSVEPMPEAKPPICESHAGRTGPWKWGGGDV